MCKYAKFSKNKKAPLSHYREGGAIFLLLSINLKDSHDESADQAA